VLAQMQQADAELAAQATEHIAENVVQGEDGTVAAGGPAEADFGAGSYEGDGTGSDEGGNGSADIEGENAVEAPTYTSPVASIQTIGSAGVLAAVLDDTDNISMRVLGDDELIGERMRAGNVLSGNLEAENATDYASAVQMILFEEYLVRYMGHYGSTDESDALMYQLEYLISGDKSDVENLKSVAWRLLGIRAAADYAFLQSSSLRTAEAKVAGYALAALILCPELGELFTQLIILGWAAMEARYDVSTLFAGGKVPLVKTDDNWHYSLAGALSGIEDGGSDGGVGLSYTDYLRILLLLTDTETLTLRAMDIVESDIRMSSGNRAFRLDGCIDTIKATVQFGSVYGHNTSITRRRAYL